MAASTSACFNATSGLGSLATLRGSLQQPRLSQQATAAFCELLLPCLHKSMLTADYLCNQNPLCNPVQKVRVKKYGKHQCPLSFRGQHCRTGVRCAAAVAGGEGDSEGSEEGSGVAPRTPSELDEMRAKLKALQAELDETRSKDGAFETSYTDDAAGKRAPWPEVRAQEEPPAANPEETEAVRTPSKKVLRALDFVRQNDQVAGSPPVPAATPLRMAAPSQVASRGPVAANTLPSSARFYACFAPQCCKVAALGKAAKEQTSSTPGEGLVGGLPLSPQLKGLKGHRSAPRGTIAAGLHLPACQAPFSHLHKPKRGGFRSLTALGSFSTADGGEFITNSDGNSTGSYREAGGQSGTEDATLGQSEARETPRDGEGEKPAAAEDTSKRKAGWIFRIFGMEKQEENVWKVPWTGSTIFQVMFLWFAAFWLVGSWAVPAAAHALGFNRSSFTYRGQAVYSLVTDLAEMLVGLGILMRCLARFRPQGVAGWFWFFPVKWSRGFWIVDTLVGCLSFPIVNMLSQINTELLPLPGSFPGGSSIEQSLSARDPIANLLYVLVVSVCAPIWEEIIFRGFLLASLTRYMPMWGSVVVSALAFAVAHFSMQRMLPLAFLGIVMGVIFVRSRNLLACMALHALWNAFVFLELLR